MSRVIRGFCQKPRIRARQFGDRFKRASRRKLMVFAATSLTATTLLIWALLPYLTPIVYHAVDITIEYRNEIGFGIGTDTANVRVLVPTRMHAHMILHHETIVIGLSVGLCRVSVGGRSYDSILVMVGTSCYGGPVVGPVKRSGIPATKVFSYVLGVFGNNSELGDFFRSYGFPYTYVEATYSYVSEGPVNRTLLSMTYPNGSLLLRVSAITSSATHPIITQPDYYTALYHLRDRHNLTIHHCKETYTRLSTSGVEGPGQANLTIGAGSLIWKALGKIEYVMNSTIYTAYPLIQLTGKIGWIKWG